MFHAAQAHLIASSADPTAIPVLSAGSTDASVGGSILLIALLTAVVFASVKLAIGAIAPVTEKVHAYKTAMSVLVILFFVAVLLIST